MAKQNSPIEITTFTQGLITESNPLTFPVNASVDENNFRILRDGTRRRRLGLDFENGYQTINSTVVPTANTKVVFSTYDWMNAGGSPEVRVSVVQTGPILKFFNALSAPLSANLIYTYDTGVANDTFLSFAGVDGNLVVATGAKDFLIFTYDSGVISVTTDTLKIRDLFGVEDYDGSTSLTEGVGLLRRPTSLTQQHRYNLRNQSFNIPRPTKLLDVQVDTISEFYSTGSISTVYPSNSDSVTYSLYPNPDSFINKTVERFQSRDLFLNPIGTFAAAKGHFIIDAMERGSSRITEYAKLRSLYSVLGYPLSSLPLDKTPGGASVVSEFAGRVWFGGFSGEVEGADEKSPYLSSYVMFSQLVKDLSHIPKCYQEADPTSKEFTDLVDTDGGFIRLSGAFGIVGMISLGDSLMVVANNGVWRISGGDSGFVATDYLVRKITDHGCSSPNSIVEVDGGVIYWGDDGIYAIAQNELGDYSAKNISQQTIQSFYDDIDTLDKTYAFGLFDSYDRKVRWLYQNNSADTSPVKELVFDVNFGAFYPSTVANISGTRPKPVCMLKIPPISVGQVTDNVVANTIAVEAATDPVIVISDDIQAGLNEILYVTLTDDSASSELQYSFSLYTDTDFKDWKSYNAIGIDANGYMVTGYLTGGDTQRKKQISSLTFHMVRTEDGFEDDGSGGWVPTNQSSCKLQSQWEWTNSVESNRWGPERQVYRYNRLYLPADINDPYDTGHLLITTKNRIRGRGRALSFLLKTEEGKDCHILGWSMIVGVDGNA